MQARANSNAPSRPPQSSVIMTYVLRGPPKSCAQAGSRRRVRPAPSTTDNQSRSMETDFDFVETPSQDYFCPVSLELLLEPQLTSCGHHLSLEAATRLQREGKPCPMCNNEQWSAVLDNYHRRKVHEVRVRCWYKDNGCEWVGEVNELKRHAESCVKRPWECKYCALKCTYGEGEGKHWPTCLKFPEPCPNGCEIGSVERCNVEQHRSVCSLEPVACEMKEFGCSVVVPRKELAAHMRESELQHLTAMTVLNLRLSRQLQQDSTERDRKIAQLQQEIADLKQLQTEMMIEQKQMQAETVAKIDEQKQMQAETVAKIDEQKQMQAETVAKIDEQKQMQAETVAKIDEQKQMQAETVAKIDEQKQLQAETVAKIDEQKQLHAETVAKIDEQKQVQVAKIDEQKQIQAEQRRELTELKDLIQKVEHAAHHIEQHTGAGACSGRQVFTFTQYSKKKGSARNVDSDPFYSHHCGYQFKLRICYYTSRHNDIAFFQLYNGIGAHICLMKGQYDDQLHWPVKVKVQLELLNQAGDHDHVEKTDSIERTKDKRDVYSSMDSSLMRYSDLESRGDGVQYVMNDCLKFRIHVTVLPA